MKVLIADPDPDSRRLFEQVLSSRNFQILWVDAGRQARSALLDPDGPELGILALDCPHCEPVELCRQLRADPSLCNRSVLMVAGAGLPQADRQAQAAGADGLLRRPIQPDQARMQLDSIQRKWAVETELREIYKAVPLSLILLDARGQVVRTNPSARSLGGSAYSGSSGGGQGVVLNCVNAVSNEEGCGRSENCHSCVLRRLIVEALSDGQPRFHREANMTLVRPDRVDHLNLLVTCMPLHSLASPMILLCLDDLTTQRMAQQKLQRSVAELEAFNEIAIGREMRMIELKQQINALSAELGRDAVFDLGFAGLNLDAPPDTLQARASQIGLQGEGV
jgi:CheY-like chemotaxis protein